VFGTPPGKTNVGQHEKPLDGSQVLAKLRFFGCAQPILSETTLVSGGQNRLFTFVLVVSCIAQMLWLLCFT
jgi:hypothetical protein